MKIHTFIAYGDLPDGTVAGCRVWHNEEAHMYPETRAFVEQTARDGLLREHPDIAIRESFWTEEEFPDEETD